MFVVSTRALRSVAFGELVRHAADTNTSFADLDLDFTAWRHRRARRHVRRLRQSVMWDVFRRPIDHINR
ncbi:hypothetical protein [Burkholderia vietnamiensis]|uniref:hypothetical protein n=1 Tax=Burkholderia vietnamiensis TaxID=60552 RepID=UPI001BA6CF51|nr:hypothetical protein [Burkholderia vietnamiensis]